MRLKDIDKKRNRANFSPKLSNAEPSKWGGIPMAWRMDWYDVRGRRPPVGVRLRAAKTMAERVACCVEIIEREINDLGRFPNWSVRDWRKDRAWNRAVRIVNARRKGCRPSHPTSTEDER